MVDGTERIAFHDVAILAQNERIVLCRVHGKVVSVAHPRLLPGTLISEGSDHGTLVVTRAVAENLGLVSGRLASRSGAESHEGSIPDRGCHDCGCLLAGGKGWIVPLDYPGKGRLIASLEKVSICDRCLLARCGDGSGS